MRRFAVLAVLLAVVVTTVALPVDETKAKATAVRFRDPALNKKLKKVGTITMYSHPECPFCKKQMELLKQKKVLKFFDIKDVRQKEVTDEAKQRGMGPDELVPHFYAESSNKYTKGVQKPDDLATELA